MHHLYWYEKFNWNLYACSKIITIGYPIGQPLKPWNWWGYPILDIHWIWQNIRMELPQQEFNITGRSILLIFVFFLVFSYVNYLSNRSISSNIVKKIFGYSIIQNNLNIITYIIGYIGVGLSIKLSLYFIPNWLPPFHAWVLFLSYNTIFFFGYISTLGILIRDSTTGTRVTSTNLFNPITLASLQMVLIKIFFFILYAAGLLFILYINIYTSIVYKVTTVVIGILIGFLYISYLSYNILLQFITTASPLL